MTEHSGQVTNTTRGRIVSEAAGFLVTAGLAMSLKARRDSDESALAMASCVQIGGSLARGISGLLRERNYYSAAALGRQILEVTWHIQYFIQCPDRAAFWITATDEEMKKAADFKPAQLRSKVNANSMIYSRHCSLGGHPRSIAQMLLPGSPWRKNDVIDLAPLGLDIRVGIQGIVLADTLQHLYDAVLATIDGLDLDAFQLLGDLGSDAIESTDRLVNMLVEWRNCDPLARIGPEAP